MQFAVLFHNQYFGPFKTADAAAKWADKGLSGPWVIVRLGKP